MGKRDKVAYLHERALEILQSEAVAPIVGEVVKVSVKDKRGCDWVIEWKSGHWIAVCCDLSGRIVRVYAVYRRGVWEKIAA